MDLSMLKTQIMTMFMMKNSQKPGGGGVEDIYAILYTMVMMNVIEAAFKNFPGAFARFQQWVWSYFMRKSHQVAFATPLLGGSKDVKVETYSITMVRKYNKTVDNKCVEKVDGVIEHLCNINTSKHIQLDQRYTLNTSDDIQVTPQIIAKVQKVEYNENGDLELVQVRISSTSLKINELRDWVDDVHRNYVFEKNNKLGNKKFFFNEVPVEPQRQLIRAENNQQFASEYNWATAPSALAFTMNEFKTFKSFRNVFGSHVGELKERLDLFVNHPEWYQDRGIPHSLGIMLYGIPGAGKTSTIKAIARDTGRHIFNLSLRAYTTQKQLMNLFFNENVQVNGGPGTPAQTYNIPLNQRIYVIEDIDCLTDIVYDRAEQAKGNGNNSVAAANSGSDAVNLGFLLNLLDGVLETPGRILVITSNYPERLDKALVRPGRIDVKIHFTWAPLGLIQEMLENFYECEMDLSEIPAELDNVLSPAEVLESLCTNFKSAQAAIEHMQKRVKERQEATENLLGAFATSEEPTMHVQETTAPNMTKSIEKKTTNSPKMINGKFYNIQTTHGSVKTPQRPPHDMSNVLAGNLLMGGGSMYETLDCVDYNSGTDITFIPPDRAEEYAAEYLRKQQSRDLAF